MKQNIAKKWANLSTPLNEIMFDVVRPFVNTGTRRVPSRKLNFYRLFR